LLISCPAPLNFFLFFIGPVLLTSKNPQRLNQKFLFVFYLPVMTVVTACFIAGEIIMWPFVYVKMVFHKLTMVWVYSKSFRVSRADKFMNFIFYFFAGPFLIIGNSGIDTWFFIRHLMMTNLRKVKHKTRFQQIDKHGLGVVERLFDEKQEKVLNIRQVSSTVRKDLHIMDLISESMFPMLKAEP
jgi:NADH:ubiquinone oxidoreductase subunit 4 (subunit M)